MARMVSMIDFSMLGRYPRKPAIPILAGRMIKRPETGGETAEVTCPTKYFAEASFVNLNRSITHGLGVLKVSFQHFQQRKGMGRFYIYEKFTRDEGD